ncbi:MAG: 4Fe-4S binding protein [Deltaproteobacteria bacterium]|nr:4Fe-4S binding protein [Deltaproteobacteria bacterium]
MNPDNSVDVYERLADALDALPAGFTRTPNKLEIELIKLVFTPEEALVASTLSRKLETAAEIAERVGLPEDKVTVLLESMIPRRMVKLDTLALETGVKGLGKVEARPGQTKEKEESVKKYRLFSFLVGWYESFVQEARPTSKEFAEIFEQYVKEGGGEKIFAPRPGSQGVIPYRGSLKPEWIKREPHNDIDAHFGRHDRFLVLDCVCKKEKAALHGHSCELPVKRCGFVGLPPQTPLSENVLTREEAIKRWEELDAMGNMVIEGFYGFTMGAEEPQFVGGCHCCGCCCTILQGGRMGNLTETVQRSNYRAVKDYDKCHSCGECVRRCQFFAHTFDPAKDDKPVYHPDKCVGCGSCGQGCPSDALHLEPIPEEEWFQVPSSFVEWEESRLKYLAAQEK